MSKLPKNFCYFGLIILAALAFGCGGAAGVKGDSKNAGGVSVGEDGERLISKKAREDFAVVVQKLLEAKKAGWTPESCDSIANKFRKVAGRHGDLAEAMYNVGVTYRSCKKVDEARAAFKEVLKSHPKHQLSMTHLAVMELEKGDEKAAEEMLRKAVGAGQNTVEAVPAYVNVATMLRMRGAKGDDEAFRKAQMNLRRALAIESKYMPALYQLAMLYLDTAVIKKQSSYLTLASLVCNQGISLDPEYGPIYHALGQILLQKNELVKALKAFETAFTKDPTLFASYMNFAAINMNFRGYEESKAAFENAIRIDPKSFDAHIGLGVALRGLSDFEGAKAEYRKAAEIDQKRTDYIFNLGVLEMDYLNPGTPDGYDKARVVFEKFAKKATEEHKIDPDGKGPKLSWLAKAEARIQKCKDNKKQIEEAEREMAELEKLAAEQKKREVEMKAAMEKAKELEEKEAAGAVAPGEGEEGSDTAEAAEEPKAEEPKAEEPKAEEPKVEEPKAEEAKAEKKE
jgi:tetratricopeptide (TPR) repeat protein